MPTIDPVVIAFATAGLTDVSKAFTTIEQNVRRLEKSSTDGATRTARARIRAVDDEAKASTKANKDAQREADRLEKYKADVRRRSSEMAGLAAGKQADAEIREAKRSAKEQEREAKRLEDFKQRVRINSSIQAGRLAERQVREELNERRASAHRVSGAFGGAIGGVAGAAGLAGGILGGFQLADAFHKQASDQQAAALLVNSATSGGVTQPGATVDNILGQASVVAKTHGVSRSDLIAGTQNYVALAGADQFGNAMKNMDFFAKLSVASGSSMNDITGAAGILQAQNKNLDSASMQQMMLDMMAQGKQGAVEIKDMAALAGTIGSARGQYAGDIGENQRKLLALAQLARPEAGSAADAATAVKDLSTEGLRNEEHVNKLKGWGVKINKAGQIEDLQQMIEASLTGSRGNMTALNEAFGLRGAKVLQHLAPIYNAAGGGEKGLEAVRAEMAPVMNVRGSPGELDAQYKTVMDTPGKKLEVAMNAISTQMENALAPALTDIATRLPEWVPAIDKAIDAFAFLADWLLKNPWSGIGLAVTGSITKDIASAALGKTVEKALATNLGAAAGSAGVVVAIAAMVGLIGQAIIDKIADTDIQKQRHEVGDSNADFNAATQLIGDARNKKLTPEQVAKAKEKLAEYKVKEGEQQAKLADAKNATFFRDERVARASAELGNTEAT